MRCFLQLYVGLLTINTITTIWLFNIAMENPSSMEVLMGESSINGPFSMAIAAMLNKVTPPVKTRAVLHSGISDVLQDMWHSCPKVFAIVVSVLPAVGPLPKALIDMACL